MGYPKFFRSKRYRISERKKGVCGLVFKTGITAQKALKHTVRFPYESRASGKSKGPEVNGQRTGHLQARSHISKLRRVLP